MKKIRTSLYEWLVVLFITTLLVSNIVSVKMVAIGPLVLDAGTILFPLSYIISDIVTEVYGYKRMRGLLIRGVVMLLVLSLTLWIVGALPAEDSWALQSSFESTLGVVWRIVAASSTAIFIGELINAYVLAKLKVRTKGKWLWGRLIGSSVVGNALDTIIFSVIAFAGTMPTEVLVQLIVSVYLIKMAIEIIVSPFTVRFIGLIKKYDKTDTFEDPHRLI